jgi:hypothetical protein
MVAAGGNRVLGGFLAPGMPAPGTMLACGAGDAVPKLAADAPLPVRACRLPPPAGRGMRLFTGGSRTFWQGISACAQWEAPIDVGDTGVGGSTYPWAAAS